MARMAMVLGGAVLLAMAGCVDDEPEQDEDAGKPFPGINRDSYRVFPKNPRLVESPCGLTPGAPLALEWRGSQADVPAADDREPGISRTAPAATTAGALMGLFPACDANLIAEQHRRFILEGSPGRTAFYIHIGGAIVVDAGAGWACPYGHPQVRPRGRVTIEGASGRVVGKIEAGAAR